MPTPNQKEYLKQISRLKRGLKVAEKRGYVVDYESIPTMPNRVTKKTINKISKLKPRDLYKDIEVINTETGEIVKNKPGLTNQTKQAGTIEDILEYHAFNLGIIDTFKSYLLGFPPAISDKLMAWLNTLIIEQGEDAVAEMLRNSPERLHDYLNRLGYDSEAAMNEYTSAMLEYLPDASEEYKNNIRELFEYEDMGYNIE